MKKAFNKPPLSEAEKFLKKEGIKYTIEDDLTITAHGNIDLINRGLNTLPNLNNVRVKGYFACDLNNLTSLKGCPKYIERHFSCEKNQLTNLKGSPLYTGSYFNCSNNTKMASLAYLPEECGMVVSDFGIFHGHKKVPQELLIDIEKRQRRIKRHIKKGMPTRKNTPRKKARFKKKI